MIYVMSNINFIKFQDKLFIFQDKNNKKKYEIIIIIKYIIINFFKKENYRVECNDNVKK